MRYASSANETCSEPRSASEYTATEPRPSSRRLRKIRIAISPRFATRTLSKLLPDIESRILPFRVLRRSAHGCARSRGADRDRAPGVEVLGSRVLGDCGLLR